MLGAADYKLVHHAGNGRSVYSFCMCPGGTRGGRRPPSRARGDQRHEPVFAQRMQRQCRHRGRHHAGRLSRWPARRHRLPAPLGGARRSSPAAEPMPPRCRLVGDFLAGRPSGRSATVVPSYKPGVTPDRSVRRCLPDYAIAAIREALPAFEPQIPGFDMADAVMTGVETRTSSPVRITARRGFLFAQHARPVPGRRGCRLRGRHPVGRGGRDQGGGGGGAQHRGRGGAAP